MAGIPLPQLRRIARMLDQAFGSKIEQTARASNEWADTVALRVIMLDEIERERGNMRLNSSNSFFS